MTKRQKKVIMGGKKLEVHNSTKFDMKKLLSSFWNKFLNFKNEMYVKSKKTAREYFENSSINCYQYIVDDTMETWEKWTWRIVHAVATGVALWLLWVAGNGALLAPVATTRAPTNAPINTVLHPAVAICPYNKISLSKATRLAEQLIANKSISYDVDRLVKLLGFLGMAYDMVIPENNELEELHKILEPYNLETLMPELAPSCDDILKKCLWRNDIVDCNKIFEFRKTMHGYCCIFNYLRENDRFISNITDNSTKRTAMPGKERGLSVVVDPKLEDYLYTTLPNVGVNVLILNSGDFPDVSSGGCFKVPIAPRTEVYLSLDAISVTSTSAVESLSPTTRGCLTHEDRKKYVDSFSDCMVSCRLRNLRTTCGCVPFFMPVQFDQDVCDLTDNMCLKRWKEIWTTAWSGEELLLTTGEIAGDAKQPPCFFCLPECEEAIYRPHQYVIPLQPDSVNSQPDSEKAVIKKGIFIVDHCVLHVYFSSDSVVRLVHGLLSNWWDLLSSLGGLCGLVLGGSLISVVEIFYYFLGGPATKFKRPRQPEMRQLYWEELRNYKRN